MNHDLMESVRQQLLCFPPAHKESEELTNAERIALCIASGCKMDYRTENSAEGGYRLIASTVNRIGIAKINGKFVIYESAATESTAK
jgi:hypothetical protein